MVFPLVSLQSQAEKGTLTKPSVLAAHLLFSLDSRFRLTPKKGDIVVG